MIDYFKEQLQLTFDGQYKNSKKDGRWDIFYKLPHGQKLQKIGGGLYGDGVKIGQWIEVSDKSYLNEVVTYNGEYWNGKKVGLWTTLKEQRQNQQLCGCVNYGDDGTVIFNNDERFKFFQKGEFRNGKKIGRWDIFFKLYNKEKFELIGGGSYDAECKGIKIGSWIELSDFNVDNRQVIYKGEYKYGKRIGRWDIVYLGEQNKADKIIGGGQYDDDGIKIGQWIEEYKWDQYITYNGEYKQGRKVGKWDIFIINSNNQFQQIGGGSYEDYEKTGNWIELRDDCQDIFGVIFCTEVYLGEFGFQICQGGYQIYQGQYKIGKRVGLWKKFNEKNKNLQLCDCLNYDEDGNEIFKNDENSKILYMGEFSKGKKIGRWDVLFWDYKKSNFEQIGGGSYDEQGNGNMIGKWIECKKGYKCNSQLTFNGEYNNGKKFGLWKTYIKRNNFKTQNQNQMFQLCGCENYNENGMEIYKSDKNSIFFYLGEFSNGKKIGRWDIYNRWHKKQDFQKIGGGSYDLGGDGNKHGKWIELSNRFGFQRELIYCGEYKNGEKVGRWDIGYRGENEKAYKKIGGGSYANRMKIGNWVELNEECQDINDLTIQSQYYINHGGFQIYLGEYKIGKKIGLWKEYIKENQNCKLCGCVNYGEDGTVIFSNDEKSNFLQMGEFSDGKKVGRWDIFFRYFNKDKFESIGGGIYDAGCEGIKIGNWIELNDQYQSIANDNTLYQVCQGDYKFGKKYGLWKKFNKIYNSLQMCGCINYNEDGTEIFSNDEKSNFLQMGKFRNGKKIGRWDILYRTNCQAEFIKIGGGQYDDQIKIGEWLDLIDSFGDNRKVIYKGEYNYGKKVGKWNIVQIGEDQNVHKIIGDGYYDNGIKIGMWTDLTNSFVSNKAVIYKGEYNQGKKVGKWDIVQIGEDQKAHKIIGGGQYDNSIKIGKWIELNEFIDSYGYNIVMYKGEYKKGNKVGLWDILQIDMYDYELKRIGGGQYNKEGDGIKIGQWMELSDYFTNFKKIMITGEYNKGIKVGTWDLKEIE